MNSHRLVLEGRSQPEHNLYIQSLSASKDPRERKELNIVNLTPPAALINWGFILQKSEAGKISFYLDIP